jgi:type I restriction enzyme M protein
MPGRQRKPEHDKSLEATLWEAADRLWSRVDIAEYTHVVFGLIFLKYLSDVFANRRTGLERLVDDPDGDYFMPRGEGQASVLEDRDEYTGWGVLWVPDGRRCDDLRKAAKQPHIGERIDAAMDAIDKDNPSLRGVPPKRYAQRELTSACSAGSSTLSLAKTLPGRSTGASTCSAVCTSTSSRSSPLRRASLARRAGP